MIRAFIKALFRHYYISVTNNINNAIKATTTNNNCGKHHQQITTTTTTNNNNIKIHYYINIPILLHINKSNNNN